MLETYAEHGRAALRGIASYVEQGRAWELYSSSLGATNAGIFLSAMKADGVILALYNPEWIAAVARARIPVVAVFHHDKLPIPCVRTNPRSIARMAADHFIAQGFHHFAFAGPFRPFSIERAQSFARALARQRFTCHTFYPSKSGKQPLTWLARNEPLIKWMRDLPKPIAMLGANDWMGQQLLFNAQLAGIRVPDEIAVLGIDNDELICRVSNPPLSSIDAAGERIGFEAAALLHQMMKFKRRSRRLILVDPVRVIVRQSSDVLAVSDPNVSAAVRFIRENLSQGLNVEDVMREIPIARRTLELAFQRHLGRTIHEEIADSRIRRARQFLIETHMSIPAICDACGFKDRTYLTTLFRQRTGHTPASFRRQFRTV